MFGIIMSAVAGASMSVQGVLNTRLGEKIGIFESNVLCQGIAFFLAVIVMLFFGKGNLGGLTEVNKTYLLGGVLGIVITVTVMLGINKLSPTYAVSVILITQLLVAALIDFFGLFGTEKVAFGITKIAGLALMIGGILLIKK